MKKDPVNVREQSPSKRVTDFSEVVLGYNEEEALREAGRCIQCKNPTCISGCPVEIDIKKFIAQIAAKDYKDAYFTIREKNNFPAICGRICPAEYQCRKTCVFTKKDSPYASEKAINIHFLERFASDYAFEQNLQIPSTTTTDIKGMKAAMVGAGPASLCCAGELMRAGIKVDIFEALHKPGGVLCYGIPPFRLPQQVMDTEIAYLKTMGVTIIPNVIIGNTKSVIELFEEGYKAIFLGLGAGTPSFLRIKGENLCNVYSANEFLTRVNLMKAYKFPEFHTPINIGKRISVIGGGNTAMDSARVAIRLQKMNNIEANVTILYRRTETEMPARRLEIEHAKEEGIKFEMLVSPLEFKGNNDGFIQKIRSIRCELGEPDSSGRRRPVPIKGSEFEIDCDVVILAVGLKANQVLIKATPDLNVDKWGDVIVDKETMATSIPNVYAGGDIVGGEGTVIEAMGMGKKAARAIIQRLLPNLPNEQHS